MSTKAITTLTKQPQKMKTVFQLKLLHQHGDEQNKTQKQSTRSRFTSFDQGDQNSSYIKRTKTELNVIELDQCLYSRDRIIKQGYHRIS